MGNNMDAAARRERYRKALKRVEVAERWVREGEKVPERFLDLGWQLRNLRRRHILKPEVEERLLDNFGGKLKWLRRRLVAKDEEGEENA
jgi:hypothetical protein